MSIYHKDKCTKEEVENFKNKVIEFLKANNITYKSIHALRSYNGEVRIHTGQVLQRLRLKMGRRLMAFKNPDGSFEGYSEDAIRELKERDGSQLWETHNDPIPQKEYFQTFRVDDWEEEKRDILDYFKRKNGRD